ncbi:MAG: DUF885 domain-containing protein, partial [Bryobacteraceae bacterium]
MANRILAACLLGLWSLPALAADSLDALSTDFWHWRAATQPFDHDDIPRVERPAAALPDWSAHAVAARRQAYDGFQERWLALANASDPVA